MIGGAVAATLPGLTGATGPLTGTDIFLCREGADTTDNKCTATQIATFARSTIPGTLIETTSNDTSFSGDFSDLAKNGYFRLTMNPGSTSTAITTALYGETIWDSSFGLTTPSHIIGSFGRVDNQDSGTVGWGIGVEGRCDNTSGNFTVCTPFAATFGDNTGSTGTIDIGAAFYHGDQTDDGHIAVKFAFFNDDADWIFRTDGDAYVGGSNGLCDTGGTNCSTPARIAKDRTQNFCVAASDETTNLTTGTAKITFRMPYAFTVTAVRGSVNTAPTGSTIIYDINEGGTTILSTKLSIDASEETSATAASAAVISDASLADDAEVTIDFDQVGSSTPGKGAKICLIGYQT